MEQTRPCVFCCPEFVSPSADFFHLVSSHILGVAKTMSTSFFVFFWRIAHSIHFPPLGLPPANLLFHFREENSGSSDQEVVGLM